jgi:hypothetical protein
MPQTGPSPAVPDRAAISTRPGGQLIPLAHIPLPPVNKATELTLILFAEKNE